MQSIIIEIPEDIASQIKLPPKPAKQIIMEKPAKHKTKNHLQRP